MNDNVQRMWERLLEYASLLMSEQRIPGVAIGLLHNEEIATAAFGVTNINHPLPITDETLFQIGSMTKTYTGMAIMCLAEAGHIDLDARIQTYIPDFYVADADVSSTVTIRHLLTHTSGWIGDFFADTGAGDDALSKYVAQMNVLTQLAPLGEVWSYNNAGFVLAGRIIERMTGKSYQAALQDLLLKPLRLQRSFFDASDVITHRFVVGHTITDDVVQVATPWSLPRSLHPAGGIICDIKDLLQYARFQLGDGTTLDRKQLLSRESLEAMHMPQVPLWGAESCGLTWMIDDTGGTRQISHTGGTVGQVSLLVLVPEYQFAIAILTNANRGGSVTKPIARLALKEFLGIESAEPTPRHTTAAELEEYVGHYCNQSVDIELRLLNEQLVAQERATNNFLSEDTPPSSPPVTLALCEKDRFFVVEGPSKGVKLDVLRKTDGTIGWLRVDQIHVRQTT